MQVLTELNVNLSHQNCWTNTHNYICKYNRYAVYAESINLIIQIYKIQYLRQLWTMWII